MEVLWPGPLFSLSVGCFGKQDCQICTEREGWVWGGGFASMVWLKARRVGVSSHSESAHPFTMCVPKTGGSFRTVAISNLLLLELIKVRI